MRNDIKTAVTVLTPVYNRAHTLPRLYQSLCNQTLKAFEWIIVDDGSTDNTSEIVKGFDTDFRFQYIKKENGGKHTAVNEGLKYVETEYTFIVDSDDYLTNDAIEYVCKWIKEVADAAGIAGVAGVRADGNKKVIGQFPKGVDYIECLNSERKQKRLLGDKAEIYKTDLLRENPFPVYEDEKFMPEGIVWNKFSLQGLKIRWHKEIIVICEYLDDGLTSATKNIEFFKKNYKGYRDTCKLDFRVMRFPYNYSAASVHYARCLAIKYEKECLDTFDEKNYKKFFIKILGRIRFWIGRY